MNPDDNKQRKPATKKESENGRYGIDPEMSLQSVNFATTENKYLNEHYQDEADE